MGEGTRADGLPEPITYDVHLRDRLAVNLDGHERRVVERDDLRRAAVAVVLVDSVAGEPKVVARHEDGSEVEQLRMLRDGLAEGAGGAAFLLCRRPLHLRLHAGQLALPGGGSEPGEDAVAAALRETREEVGLDLGEDAVLGLLDDYVTRSGYVMTPVVVWGGDDVQLRPDPGEVMSVYRVGLHQLERAGSPRFARIPESDRPVVELLLGGAVVHAPTAAVLVQLGWLGLHGRSDPVAHFEQPVFAWR